MSLSLFPPIGALHAIVADRNAVGTIAESDLRCHCDRLQSIVLHCRYNQLGAIDGRTAPDQTPSRSALSSVHSNQTVHLKASLTSAISPPQRHGYQPRLMPYRDVGAASQSMDSRQPKASRKSVAVHNSFPATDGRAMSRDVVVDGNDDGTHVTSPPAAAAVAVEGRERERVRERAGRVEGRRDSFYLLAPGETRPPSDSREKTAVVGLG